MCRELDGKGNHEIKKYVRHGGRYLGLCAGGYYGCSQIEFEMGNPAMQVAGLRELKFYPGTARGAVYKGFDYSSAVNARASKLQVCVNQFNLTNESRNILSQPGYAYVHGGCLFVDADQYKHQGVEVLARYLDPLAVRGSDISKSSIDAVQPAATVFCKVGHGCAILTGLHPEFGPDLLKRVPSNHDYMDVIHTLEAHNIMRIEFMRALLQKMGLTVNATEVPVPSLSRLSLTSAYPPSLEHLVHSWAKNIGFSGHYKNEIKGNTDRFRIWDASRNDRFLAASVPNNSKEHYDKFDFDKIVKEVDVYYRTLPDYKDTPLFNHKLYYNSLQVYRNALGPGVAPNIIGTTIMYGEVVTSTSTLLFNNLNLLRLLPNGFTSVGTVQVAGRGRANNVWVSPKGVLAFSTVLRLPLHNDFGGSSLMIFVQYLAAIAIVEAIRAYAHHNLGIADFPVYIKWPNDVYIVNPVYEHNPKESNKFYKVSGILVNTTIIDSEFILVIGIGINVDNLAPSKSLNTFIDELNANVRTPRGRSPYGHFEMEALLAKFMSIWEIMVRDFQYQGFVPFEKKYYDLWLHTNKLVTLEQYGNTKAIIRGISKDYGMLIAEEVDSSGRPSGKRFELQPDGNSFDMLRGLLKKKT